MHGQPKLAQWCNRPCGAGRHGLGGLLLVWVLAYALAPIVAKAQIEKIASSKLGRVITVDVIDFKPWMLELMVNDLIIAKRRDP